MLNYLLTLLLFALAALALVALGISARRLRSRRPVPGELTAPMLWPRLFFCLSLLFLALVVAGLWWVGFRVGYAGLQVPIWKGDQPSSLDDLLQARCTPFVSEGKSLGLLAAVVRDDQVSMMGFGRASLSPGDYATGETLFEIGSVTKTFTGLLLAQAIEDGTLRLEQTLAELLPPDVVLPPPAREITLRHLTTHTSGFPRLAGTEESMYLPALGMMLLGSDPYAHLTENDYLESLRKLELEYPVGERSEYSNFGVTILGWLLARQAGMDYQALLQLKVCAPLGLKDTTIVASASQDSRTATGYRALSRRAILTWGLTSQPWLDQPNLAGAGGIRSTGHDMLKYLQAQMRLAGSPLEKAMRRSHEPLFTESPEHSIAMNWMRSRKKGLSSTLLWHNGATGGFHSFLGFTEDGRHGVLVLANTSTSVDQLAMEILRAAVALK